MKNTITPRGFKEPKRDGRKNGKKIQLYTR